MTLNPGLSAARARPLASMPALRQNRVCSAQVRIAMSPAAQHNQGAISSEAELLALLETLYNSRNPTRRWLHCTRRDWIIAKIQDCARERAGRALETGFGAGVYLPALAESYREVVAADLDQAHIDHARPLLIRYPNLCLITDDITKSRLPEASFDLILCSEVLEHIPDTARVIDGLHRCAHRHRLYMSQRGIAELMHGEIRKALGEDRPQRSDQQHVGLLGWQ